MDYIRTSGSRRTFSTYIFQNDYTWKYDNSNQRPTPGNPKIIRTEWSALPNDLDAYVHYWEYDEVTKPFSDRYFFFKGIFINNSVFFKLKKKNT